MGQVGLFETHALKASAELGVAALHRIGGQRPGRPDEPNQGGLALSFFSQRLNRI